MTGDDLFGDHPLHEASAADSAGVATAGKLGGESVYQLNILLKGFQCIAILGDHRPKPCAHALGKCLIIAANVREKAK